jgi:hypothetical protein
MGQSEWGLGELEIRERWCQHLNRLGRRQFRRLRQQMSRLGGCFLEEDTLGIFGRVCLGISGNNAIGKEALDFELNAHLSSALSF